MDFLNAIKFGFVCIKDATKRTKERLDVTVFLLTLIASFVMALMSYNNGWLEWGVIMNEAYLIILITLAPFGLLCLGFFGWNLLLAPSRILKEKDDEISLYKDAYGLPLISLKCTKPLFSDVQYLPENISKCICNIIHVSSHVSIMLQLGTNRYQDWGHYKDRNGEMCIVRIKNYDDIPIFNISIPIVIFCRKMLYISEHSKTQKAGDIVFETPENIVGNTLEPKSEIIILLNNETEYCVDVRFKEFFSGELPNGKQVKIPCKIDKLYAMNTVLFPCSETHYQYMLKQKK